LKKMQEEQDASKKGKAEELAECMSNDSEEEKDEVPVE
jgi:hypothetical protein